MVLLTEKIILARARAHDLAGVKTLNCWGSELTDVSILQQVPNVEVINASVNEIQHLDAFSSCHNLKELYLRRNKIQSIEELTHLSNLKDLKFLWLSGNPFCQSLKNEDYRQAVIKILPQIQKLDNYVVTSSELQKALQSTLETEESVAGDAEISLPVATPVDPNSSSQKLDVSSSSVVDEVQSATALTDNSPSSNKAVPHSEPSNSIDSGDLSLTSPLKPAIATGSSTFPETQDTLQETNKIRLELGLHPISSEKFNLPTQHFKRPKRHRKHTTGNILKASLCLINELDVVGLLAVQDAVQERLLTLENHLSVETSKDFLPG